MTSTFDLMNKETYFIKTVLLKISKYSQGEIFITDENFNILFRNADCKQGENFLNLDENIVNQDFKEHLEKFKLSGTNHLFIKMIFNPNGDFNSLPVDVHICKSWNKKNILKGFAIIIQDITNEIENRIQRETFIDILSHDLRNPLRANIQVLELILQNKFGEINNKQKIILDEILDSCKFMNYMAENLVTKYKNDFIMYELLKEPYSIVKLIKSIYNSLSDMLNKRNQSLELEIKGKIKDVNIDVDAIKKAIKILILNASEYNQDRRAIKIQVENSDNYVDITFLNCTNTLKHPDDIFEEYLNCSNRFRKVGFSLEFYNCKKIIEAHQGEIYAQNTDFSGLQVKIRLPVY